MGWTPLWPGAALIANGSHYRVARDCVNPVPESVGLGVTVQRWRTAAKSRVRASTAEIQPRSVAVVNLSLKTRRLCFSCPKRSSLMSQSIQQNALGYGLSGGVDGNGVLARLAPAIAALWSRF